MRIKYQTVVTAPKILMQIAEKYEIDKPSKYVSWHGKDTSMKRRGKTSLMDQNLPS